jgi:hypothetical protein
MKGTITTYDDFLDSTQADLDTRLQSEVIDNTAEVKAFNDREIQYLMDDLKFKYGIEDILSSNETEIYVDSVDGEGRFRVECPDSEFFREEDGKLIATGMCQHESRIKAALINASTINTGRLAAAYGYTNEENKSHVRVRVEDKKLASELPVESADSSLAFRRFQIPEDVDPQTDKLIGVTHTNDTVSLTLPNKFKDGTEFMFNDHGEVIGIKTIALSSSIIAQSENTPESVVHLACGKIGNNICILVLDNFDNSNTLIVGNTKTWKTMVYDYRKTRENNGKYLEIAKNIGERLRFPE